MTGQPTINLAERIVLALAGHIALPERLFQWALNRKIDRKFATAWRCEQGIHEVLRLPREGETVDCRNCGAELRR